MSRATCSAISVWAAVLLAAQAMADQAMADQASVDELAFMAGAWGVGGEIVETWLPPLRGLMVGVNRDPQGDSKPFFEFLRIETRDDGVFYVASPNGGATTDFRLTEISASRAVFENPEHDFPQRIVYTRSGDRLEAEVTAERDGEQRGFTLSWSRIACPAGSPGEAVD